MNLCVYSSRMRSTRHTHARVAETEGGAGKSHAPPPPPHCRKKNYKVEKKIKILKIKNKNLVYWPLQIKKIWALAPAHKNFWFHPWRVGCRASGALMTHLAIEWSRSFDLNHMMLLR